MNLSALPTQEMLKIETRRSASLRNQVGQEVVSSRRASGCRVCRVSRRRAYQLCARERAVLLPHAKSERSSPESKCRSAAPVENARESALSAKTHPQRVPRRCAQKSTRVLKGMREECAHQVP